MISVCIPTYNGEKFIEKQISSILMQLSVDDEVIISDDSSTDSTLDIIKSFNDARIRIFENNHFKSTIFNLENALNQAQGDYIFLADQDDLWEVNKVKIIMSYLNKNDLVLSNCKLIDENDHVIQSNYFHYYFGKDKPSLSFFKNLYKNPYLGCSMAFNRNVLGKVLPFPRKIAMHDIWIGLLCELKFKVFFTSEILFSWRRHQNNVTFAISRPDNKLSDNTLFYKLSYRLQMLFCLGKRLIFNK